MFLRQSCKLNCEKNVKIIEQLQTVWKSLQLISQEQMTRLRVSAVFHRSVEVSYGIIFKQKYSLIFTLAINFTGTLLKTRALKILSYAIGSY